jgi:hypothetical protein
MDWLNLLRTSLKGFLLWQSSLFLLATAMQGTLFGQEPIPRVCVVVGAEGEPQYGKMFQQWRKDWSKAAGGMTVQWIGREDTPERVSESIALTDRDILRNWIAGVESAVQEETYWLILIGHGTFDGKSAKFNLRGADVSALELGSWLEGSKHRWVIAVCASSSGPFLPALSRQGRTVITATNSGAEANFSRFGGFLAQSISDISSDLDHDQAISAMEAFVSASRKTEQYYEENKLLATEHALLDDNGDGKGTGADFYRGLKPIKRSDKGLLDGDMSRGVRLKASPNQESLSSEAKTIVNDLEKQIDALRAKKETMQESPYYAELERLLTELARTLYPESK